MQQNWLRTAAQRRQAMKPWQVLLLALVEAVGAMLAWVVFTHILAEGSK